MGGQRHRVTALQGLAGPGQALPAPPAPPSGQAPSEGPAGRAQGQASGTGWAAPFLARKAHPWPDGRLGAACRCAGGWGSGWCGSWAKEPGLGRAAASQAHCHLLACVLCQSAGGGGTVHCIYGPVCSKLPPALKAVAGHMSKIQEAR